MTTPQALEVVLDHITRGPHKHGTAADHRDRDAMTHLVDRMAELEESVSTLNGLIDVQNEAIQKLGDILFRRAGVIQ